MVRSSLFIRIAIVLGLAWFAAAFAQSAQADSLTIAYTAITFQLTGVLHNFEPYVASFVDGIPFPGITLGPGASTGVMDLAIVTLQPFDPSLPYPGNVGIALEAINPMSGSIFTENDASIHVVTATPEPSATVLLLSAFGGLLFAGMTSSKLRLLARPGNF